MTTDFNTGLDKNRANYAALSPLDYIVRAAEVYGERHAVVHGTLRQSWATTYARTRRLASALSKLGVGKGDTVAVMLPNTPAMVEASFGVPMAGAVLNALNIRLDIASLAFMLRHGQAKVLLADTEFADAARQLGQQIPELIIIQVNDLLGPADVQPFGLTDYESLLAAGDADFAWQPPDDEWDAIALNYTSGTTGDPKGVVYHHRGAALNALSNILEWDMPKHAVYLWTLPMFHCNGWCFPWTVAARAGINVCLRKFDPKVVFDLIREHRVSHYCAAPIVHAALANAPASWREGIVGPVRGMVAGAPPPAAMLARIEAMGFDLIHAYGLTEVYGPASICAEQDEWAGLSQEERAQRKSRQGVRYHLQGAISVLDPATLRPVAADGQEVGEIMFRGNICMKGYLKNDKATREAFAGGWFHTGDLGVIYPDGYIKLKDRSKDIIISGGENISSVEVEDALYHHPDVLAAAVIAQPDEKWGETPCAFVELREGGKVTEAELIAFCKTSLAGFKVPKAVHFGPLPRTSTGKIQKFELRKRMQSGKAIDV
ncbi:acyl-CoA synthetase [Janthinobacterium agaricidamnosum]|uniref:AMP-binding enzyme family protein n=1 Tax=Janthinobacterium agaricidamnosum NBRC 102515 = DSM 9628 TaxID=1349767 RepID=W0V8H0_9BURK|nr:acyl-CoA synthetase [Janthinobacterium agaricidamnosum]CDG83643.1 AMP-binding enzyme family protein [Janthinobacterium agaricidamnosum NBRC 102515 = DSM 9628]